MRYTHTNFRFKEGSGRKTRKFWRQPGDSVHQNAALDPETVTKSPVKSCCKLYLETEEWVSG